MKTRIQIVVLLVFGWYEAAFAKDSNLGAYAVQVQGLASLDLILAGFGNTEVPLCDEEKHPPSPALRDFRTRLKKIIHSSTLSGVICRLSRLSLLSKRHKSFFPLYQALDENTKFTWKFRETCPTPRNPERAPIPGKTLASVIQNNEILLCGAYSNLPPFHRAAVIVHQLIRSSLTEISLTKEFVGDLFLNGDKMDADTIGFYGEELFSKMAETRFNILGLTQKTYLGESISDKQIPNNIRVCYGEGVSSENKLVHMLWAERESCQKDYFASAKDIVFKIIERHIDGQLEKNLLALQIGPIAGRFNPKTGFPENICTNLITHHGERSCDIYFINDQLNLIVRPWIMRSINNTMLKARNQSERDIFSGSELRGPYNYGNHDLSLGSYTVDGKDSGFVYWVNNFIPATANKFAEIEVVRYMNNTPLLISMVLICHPSGICKSVIAVNNFQLKRLPSRKSLVLVSSTGSTQKLIWRR